MAYGDLKELTKRAASDKILHDKYPKMMNIKEV